MEYDCFVLRIVHTAQILPIHSSGHEKKFSYSFGTYVANGGHLSCLFYKKSGIYKKILIYLEKLNYDSFPLISPSALKTTRPRWSLPPPSN